MCEMVNFIIFSNGVNTFLIQNAPTSQQESNSFQVEDQIRVCAHVSLLSPDYHVPGKNPSQSAYYVFSTHGHWVTVIPVDSLNCILFQVEDHGGLNSL